MVRPLTRRHYALGTLGAFAAVVLMSKWYFADLWFGVEVSGAGYHDAVSDVSHNSHGNRLDAGGPVKNDTMYCWLDCEYSGECFVHHFDDDDPLCLLAPSPTKARFSPVFKEPNTATHECSKGKIRASRHSLLCTHLSPSSLLSAPRPLLSFCL